MDGRSGQPQLRKHDFQSTGLDIAVCTQLANDGAGLYLFEPGVSERAERNRRDFGERQSAPLLSKQRIDADAFTVSTTFLRCDRVAIAYKHLCNGYRIE